MKMKSYSQATLIFNFHFFGSYSSCINRVPFFLRWLQFDSGAGTQLLEIVMKDGNFNPVPEWVSYKRPSNLVLVFSMYSNKKRVGFI